MSKALTQVIKALGDETRMNVLKHVLAKGEISCQALSKKFQLAQPTMSHHIGKLIDANVLKVRKEGVAHYYSVNIAFLTGLGINAKTFFRHV